MNVNSDYKPCGVILKIHKVEEKSMMGKYDCQFPRNE